jgi:hypothetical protein
VGGPSARWHDEAITFTVNTKKTAIELTAIKCLMQNLSRSAEGSRSPCTTYPRRGVGWGRCLEDTTSVLFRRGSDWCVFVARRGRAQRQTVSIGQRGATEAEVLSGLAPGDVVVLHPSDKMDEGVRVRML